ncbi:MAG: hypothetical protein KME05_02845 [Gloeocapsa sp. UFS-A4-WI-NPMV-4B04]|jgi:hypothetical protein|nr:hypothetical protein [Gloeocapsa sp. UFS-A4-WI-NPMV-4B04]
MNKSKQQQWNEEHPDVVQKAQQEYNKKRPIWSFRPTPENLEWLEEERWLDENCKPESDASLLNRKLEKLKKLESQGY